MAKFNKINPVARAVAIIASVMALATGVTFAAFQNTATLTNNTILATDIDGLLVDSDNDGTFAATDEGFAFNNVDPGGTSDAKPFQLKNSTNDPGSLTTNVQITGESPLPAGVDASDIKFTFTSDEGSVTYTWAQLTPTDGQFLTTLTPGETEDLTVKVSLDASVPDGVSIPSFNFTFGDVAPVAPPSEG